MQRHRHLQMRENAFSQVHPEWERKRREQEELQQIQEKGIQNNADARLRRLPTAEEVVNGLSQSCPRCRGDRIEVLSTGEIMCKNPGCMAISIKKEEK